MTTGQIIAAVLIAFVLGVSLGHWTVRAYNLRRDRMQRRIGWGFGYGAGWVDRNNPTKSPHTDMTIITYDPTPPFDGKSRLSLTEAMRLTEVRNVLADP
jgi:hypothetical protein